jgi:hypothetical protein
VPDHARSPDGRLAATSFYYLDLRAPSLGERQEP